MKKIFKKIVAKSDIKPWLRKVFIGKEDIVATDSYVMVAIKHALLVGSKFEESAEIMSGKGPAGTLATPDELGMPLKVQRLLPMDETVDFPHYKDIIPTKEELNANYYGVKVNPEFLATVAKAIADANTLSEMKEHPASDITLYVPKTGVKAVILQRMDGMATGLIMPLVR